MRDLFITMIVFGILPLIFKNPHLGILLWSWMGYMNPHRLSWGFAYDFPFAAVIGIVTIAACFISYKKLRFFWSPAIAWLLIFILWMIFTTIFSLQPESATQLNKVLKIQLMVFITLFVMHDREKIHALIWIIALSIGFYGVKGGIFTLMSGGGEHVLGPPGSFIFGNTEIGLALVMVLPLIWYLYLNTVHPWVRAGLVVALLLLPISILGTQSRGALLAIIAIGFFLWAKSRKKFLPFITIAILAPLLYLFMPETWHDRMNTMREDEVDNSVQGRFDAWEFAYRMASSRFLGGGFESFNGANYERFAPGLVDASYALYQDSHSIYFSILGHHGFVGLGIFLILGFMFWRTANRIMKLTKGSVQYKWAYDLASMLQVTLVGYAVGGAFLGLAYFDLIYHLFIILIVVRRIIETQNDSTHDPKTAKI